MSDQPETVIAIYRVQAEYEERFRELLGRHHPTLHAAGLVTDEPPTIYRGEEEGRPILFEIFHWKNAEAPTIAHERPDVMAVWEPMGTLVEERDGRPGMLFPHVKRIDPLTQ